MARTDTQTASLRTPSYLGTNAVSDISGALTALLADTLALSGMSPGRTFATTTC